jgi:hypothetical protein
MSVDVSNGDFLFGDFFFCQLTSRSWSSFNRDSVIQSIQAPIDVPSPSRFLKCCNEIAPELVEDAFLSTLCFYLFLSWNCSPNKKLTNSVPATLAAATRTE